MDMPGSLGGSHRDRVNMHDVQLAGVGRYRYLQLAQPFQPVGFINQEPFKALLNHVVIANLSKFL